MKKLHAAAPLVTAAFICCLSTTSFADPILIPVVSSGLTNPVFIANAGDRSNRLFIVEQAGIIRVLQPSASVPTVFLDIRSRVLAGGERGLLGLAFHPQYAFNRRFFVYYTRPGDGTIVIAEYGSSDNPDVANTTERILLTIPHPTFGNHNGGMLAFGPDGYLHIGVGDGGSANDPPNNAQNINVLLGKILRIDIDRTDSAAGTPYASPPDNPYVGVAGRDEIFSIGWRNPWRFSFDRVTRQQWVADVGQNAREEVNTPIVKGGNYGWRVFEGDGCTNNDPTLCNRANYLFPVFDYFHAQNRCSVTGGYVYRGIQGTLPAGTYVYGDYCTGEVFSWDGATQNILFQENMRISSFGEDEEGELYVVNIDGTVSRISSTTNTIARVIEYYHPVFDHYFITEFQEEISLLDHGTFSGWVRTGQSFNAYVAGAPGTTPVCRFFSTSFNPKSSHFYTSNAPECAIVQSNPDWVFEGETLNVSLPFFGTDICPAGTRPLYRLYNDGQGGAPNHRYTTELALRDLMIAQGWIPEGDGIGVIACVLI